MEHLQELDDMDCEDQLKDIFGIGDDEGGESSLDGSASGNEGSCSAEESEDDDCAFDGADFA